MRSTSLRLLAVAALTVGVVACEDAITNDTGDPALIASAFNTALVGFENTPTSFDITAYAANPWTPNTRSPFDLAGPGDHGPGHGGPMMGGGLGEPFLGFGPFFGFGLGLWGDGHLSSSCTYNATTQRVECPPVTRNGITTTRSVQYATASGTVQQKWDSVTTDRINTKVTVTGTLTRRDGGTTAVNHAGDRTVSGLAKGTTKITVNGAATGRETTNAKDSVGAYTAVRTLGDTTKSVVIPVASGKLSPPASGSVIHQMVVTLTRGSTTTTSSRREVVTYNGSDTATVVITKDGTTTTCKLPLKGHRGPPASCK